jgi:hypothetical protein
MWKRIIRRALELSGYPTSRVLEHQKAMPESLSRETLVEIGTRLYDALPKIADAFLKHAQQAGLGSDLRTCVVI